MIEIRRNENDFSLFFGGSPAFSFVLQFVKTHKWRYDPENKCWGASPGKFLKDLVELQDFDQVSFVGCSLADLEKAADPTITVPIRRTTLDEELFELFPPLKDYQKFDVLQMLCKTRYLLGLEMALGKTYITIQTLNHLFKRGEIDRVLIAVIPSVLHNWPREIKEFGIFAKPEDILVITEENRDVDFSQHKVVICSHNTLVLMSDYYYKKNNKGKKSKDYRKPPIDFSLFGNKRAIVVDESHKIKNHKSRWCKVLSLHKNFFDFRYLLTGTPYPNSVAELFSQIKFLDDSIIPYSYEDWLETVAVLGTRFSKYAVKKFKEKEVEKFLNRISPFFVRRFQKDHLDLPELNIKRIYCPWNDQQKKIYQYLISTELFKLQEKENAETGSKKLEVNKVFSKFPYLRIALSDPCFFEGKDLIISEPKLAEALAKWKFNQSSKYLKTLEILKEIYEEDSKQKTILWDIHPKTMDALKIHLEQEGYKVLVLHGENTPKGMDKELYRDQVCSEFKTNDNQILIANPSVIGTGKNLQFVKNVIYYTRSDSLIEFLQSVMRVKRPGMGTIPAKVWILLMSNSLDIIQDFSLKNKEKLDKFLHKKEALGRDEWVKVFNGDTSLFADC